MKIVSGSTPPSHLLICISFSVKHKQKDVESDEKGLFQLETLTTLFYIEETCITATLLSDLKIVAGPLKPSFEWQFTRFQTHMANPYIQRLPLKSQWWKISRESNL